MICHGDCELSIEQAEVPIECPRRLPDRTVHTDNWHEFVAELRIDCNKTGTKIFRAFQDQPGRWLVWRMKP